MVQRTQAERILEATPEERKKLYVINGKLRKRKDYEARRVFTREELISFLVKHSIKKICQLNQYRVANQDPSFVHYRHEFGKWSTAIEVAFGDKPAFVITKFSDTYILQVMVQFELYKTSRYKEFHKKRPDLSPCFDTVIARFGSFTKAVYAAHVSSFKEMINRYIELSRKLGRKPSFEECFSNNIDLSRLLKHFKRKGSLDDFVKELQNIGNFKVAEDVKNEK